MSIFEHEIYLYKCENWFRKHFDYKKLYNVEYEFIHIGNYNDTYKKLIDYFKDNVEKLENF